jgi:murein DD-endopeptidase MepM/ murein hydrolase activator NlpD
VAAQQIARVGSTGASTGCHLHFMIRVHGALTNPVPFMAARGIRLG